MRKKTEPISIKKPIQDALDYARKNQKKIIAYQLKKRIEERSRKR